MTTTRFVWMEDELDFEDEPTVTLSLWQQRRTEFYNRCHTPDSGEFCDTEEGVRYFGDYKMEYISPEMGSGLHKIVATYGDKIVGQLQWSTKQIEGLDVDNAHQRKGLATAMFKWGQEMRPAPKHSNDRTDQGDAWAKAMGGKIPRRLPQPPPFEYAAAVNTEFANPCHDEETGEFCETGAKGPYDKHMAVFEAAEAYAGDTGRQRAPFDHFPQMERAAEQIATKGRLIPNDLPALPAKDAALLISAIPQSPPAGKTLYRGTESIEGLQSGSEPQVGDVLELPLASVTPDYRTAAHPTYNRGAIYEFPPDTPWIHTEGIAGIDEGIVSGKFKVISTRLSLDQDDATIYTLTPAGDYRTNADKVLEENGWDFGPNLSVQASAAAAQTFSNECHDENTGRFCETGGNPRESYESVYKAANHVAGVWDFTESVPGVVLDYYPATQRAATQISQGKTPKPRSEQSKAAARDAAILMSAIPKSPPSEGPLFRATSPKAVGPLEVGSTLDIPLGSVSPDRWATEPYDKGVVIQTEPGTHWTRAAGMASIKEGLISGQFLVTKVETEEGGTKLITVKQTGNFQTQAETYMTKADIQVGPKLPATTTAREYSRAKEQAYLDERKVEAKRKALERKAQLVGRVSVFSNTCHSPDSGEFCETHGTQFSPGVQTYLHEQYQMSPETANRLGLKQEGTKLLIPIKDEQGHTTATKWRDTAVLKGEGRWGPPDSKYGLSVYDTPTKIGTVFVVESPSEGLILAGKGHRVIFFDGADSLVARDGTVNQDTHARLQALLKGQDSILIPDNDVRGRAFADAVAPLVSRRVNPPEGDKDLREYLIEGGDLATLTAAASLWKARRAQLHQFSNSCHDTETGKFCETGGMYQPDDTAPDEGEFVMEDGSAVRWRQSHRRLVVGALHSWKGDPVDMNIHMRDAKENAKQPSSGTGKKWRAQAEALLWEIHHHGKPNPKTLYRGADTAPKGLEGWSENKRVAQSFQKKGRDGKLFKLEKGQGEGIRIQDYVHSVLTDVEKEWIIDSSNLPAVLASITFSNDCHDPETGEFCETEGDADEAEAAQDDYRMDHQPPSPKDSANLTELDKVMGEDVYENPQYYDHSGGSNAYDKEAARIIKKLKGADPETPITIYRAAPPGVTSINKGDWVSISRKYVEEHAKNGDPEGDGSSDWPIYETTVPVKDVYFGGNDIVEQGYWGPDKAVTASAAPLPLWKQRQRRGNDGTV